MKTKAIAYVIEIILVFLFALGVTSVQLLDGSVPEFELNSWQFGAHSLLSVPLVLFCGKGVLIERQHVPMLGAMIFLFITFNLCYYSAPLYLPVGTLDAISSAIVVLLNAVLDTMPVPPAVTGGDRSGR